MGAKKDLIQPGKMMLHINNVAHSGATLTHQINQFLLPHHMNIVASQKIPLAIEIYTKLGLG